MLFFNIFDFALNSDSESLIQKLNSTKSSTLIKTTDYNNLDFKLLSIKKSPIYIFQNSLFI